MHAQENRSTNVQNTIICQMSKPGKEENSTGMLCKEALKRRVHKRRAPWEPKRKTWDITGLRYVLILHIVVVQRLHCVLDVLRRLCRITVSKKH